MSELFASREYKVTPLSIHSLLLKRTSVLYFIMMTPKPCHAYYYGGLPVKGSRRKGRLWVEEDKLHFEAPEGKGAERIHLEIPFSKMEKIFLSS